MALPRTRRQSPPRGELAGAPARQRPLLQSWFKLSMRKAPNLTPVSLAAGIWSSRMMTTTTTKVVLFLRSQRRTSNL